MEIGTTQHCRLMAFDQIKPNQFNGVIRRMARLNETEDAL
jgi:hypothetical protein